VITGRIRYFKSRNQWLRAIRQQARLLRDSRGDLITNLKKLRRKTPQQIKKILALEKQRIALRRQQAIEKKRKSLLKANK